jgi:formyltetrahydrofolate hydrolase
MPNPNRVVIFVSRQQECMILPLWRQGYDTLDIAFTLALPEYEVANRLWKLRQQQGN